jgi:FKBP-type peptidyl-prolyl cis-trans isomerase 2
MATNQPSRVLLAVLIVVVLVAGGIGAALLYEYSKPKSSRPVLSVQPGDNVTVNYIGEFGSGAQQGRVFDTSYYSVATNNASYPKSLEYQPRSSPSAYTPLPVHVGAYAPGSGYTIGNLTFGSVVTGFWQGLLGLVGNQSHVVVVPPGLGYGPLNSSCLATEPLVFSVAVLRFVPVAQFATLYPNGTATTGAVFPDPTYGWNDTVFAVNSTSITLQALPSVGESSSPNGVPFVVSDVNATSITLTSRLTPSDAGLVLGHATSGGLCGKSQFIVNAVDLTSGTFTENFNPEVQGETLDFVVTVVDILPA